MNKAIRIATSMASMFSRISPLLEDDFASAAAFSVFKFL
jgi:hypothetical protein